jgi:hypothetical protein
MINIRLVSIALGADVMCVYQARRTYLLVSVTAREILRS